MIEKLWAQSIRFTGLHASAKLFEKKGVACLLLLEAGMKNAVATNWWRGVAGTPALVYLRGERPVLQHLSVIVGERPVLQHYSVREGEWPVLQD